MKRKHEVSSLAFAEIEKTKTSFIITSNPLRYDDLHIYKLRKDFNPFLKMLKESASITCSGKLFQPLLCEQEINWFIRISFCAY